MWIMKAPAEFIEEYGSNVTIGGQEVKNGIVFVEQQFHKQFFTTLHFLDITPNAVKKQGGRKDVKKILILRYGGYGDILMALPVIEALSAQYPDAQLDVMFDLARKDILERHPAISRVIEGHPQYIGLFVDTYDLVIDFSTIIPNNPDAYRVNAYALHFTWAGLPLPKVAEEKVPSLTFTKEERLGVKEFLEKEGVGGRIVVCNFDTSTPLRTYPYNKARDVVISLAVEFPEITFIVSGNSVNHIWNRHRFSCPKCGVDTSAALSQEPEKQVEAPLICSCGAKFFFTPHREGVECQKDLQKEDTYYIPWFKKPENMRFFNLAIREFALLISEAELVLCADSVPGHLAGAVGTPSLSVFSSFAGDLRLSHFPKAKWIQHDYKCGPCFKHDTTCDNAARQGKQFPLCMDSLPVEKVAEVASRLLRNLDVPQETRVSSEKGSWEVGAEIFEPPTKELFCKICGEPARLVARKGYFWYLRCDVCSSAHLWPLPSNTYLAEMYDDPKYNTVYRNAPVIKKWSEQYAEKLTERYFSVGMEGYTPKLLEIGSNLGFFLEAAKKQGWDVLGVEVNSDAVATCAEMNLPVIQGMFTNQQVLDQVKENGPYDGIILHQVLEHFPDYVEFINKQVTPYLKKGGFVSIVIPDSETWQGQAEWPHINCHFAGEHVMLAGNKGLKIVAEKCGYTIGYQEKLPSLDIWVIFEQL